jgi:hypothetical protein
MCSVWDELAAMPCASKLIVGPFRLGWYHSRGASPRRFTKPPFEGCLSAVIHQDSTSQSVSGRAATHGQRCLTRGRRRPQPPLSSFLQGDWSFSSRRTRGSTATWLDKDVHGALAFLIVGPDAAVAACPNGRTVPRSGFELMPAERRRAHRSLRGDRWFERLAPLMA